MLERKNINIPISGGENQGEDGYLLKPPYLQVTNGYYRKDGSIKKRGAYQFLQAGFSSSATPFVLRDSLCVIDNAALYKWRTPASGTTRTLKASTVAVPPRVSTLPSQYDGALEVVAAANAATVTMLWSQPVPPDPDAADTNYKKHYNLFIAQYNEDDLVNPTVGPFLLTDSGTPVDMEELSLIYTGGFWCVTGIRRSDSVLRTAVFQTLSSGTLSWQTVNSAGAINYYDVTYVSGATSLYYVLQYENDTSSTTAASRTWGYTEGVNAAINGVGSLAFSRVLLGTVGASDNYVGDAGVAIHAKGSTLWIAVASYRHDNLYVYTTNLSFGSKSAATLVHTFVADQPWVNGNWGNFLTALKGSRAYPYYEDQQSVVPSSVDGTWGTDFAAGTNCRVGRICFSTTTAGVRVFWDGPILDSNESWNGYGGTTWSSVWGVAWKTVTDALSVGSDLGFASSSFLASKPLSSGNSATIVLGMSCSRSVFVGNPLAAAFTPDVIHSGLSNYWFSGQPLKAASWRMGQLCQVSGVSAVPISQFGADLLTGREWGLKDAARIYERGTHEPPPLSTRRMEYLFETSDRKIVFGAAYLVRGAPSAYERPAPVSAASYDASVDANMHKAVLVAFEQNLAPRSTAVVVGDEAYIANGWLSVFDGDNVREASPNFIPPAPDFSAFGGSGPSAEVSVSWFVVDKANRVLRTSRSPVAPSTSTPSNIRLYNAPPSYAGVSGTSRFEVWYTSDTSASTATRRGVGDPAAFSTSGPYVFEQRLVSGFGEASASSSELQPEPLGGCVYVTATSNRVWYIEPEDIARVRFSKDFSVLGRVEFNRNLYVDIPDGSRPVAVATLDEQVVIFTDRSIFLVVGNLPNNAGGGANFYLQRVAFEDGCSNRYSILESRLGVFFESDRGINLLTRGYEVLFVGSGVEDSAFGGDSVTGTAYLPQEDLFLFTTSDKTLVCQETAQGLRWTEWLYEHDGDIVASCAWGNYHVVLDSDGNLYYANMEAVTDVLMTLTTPWLYFGDLEGFQRIRDINLLGRNDTVTPVGRAVIQVGYEFSDSFSETRFYDYGTDVSSSPMRIRVKPARQKCSCFRLRFTEVAETVGQSTTNEAAITISGISVEAAVKSLGVKRPRNSTTTP